MKKQQRNTNTGSRKTGAADSSFAVAMAESQVAYDARKRAIEPEPCDFSDLVPLARTQWTEYPLIADSFARCTTQWPESELYTYFIDPTTIHKPGSAWQFAGNFFLSCPVRGTLVVDVMKDGSIGGIEYLDRVMGHKVNMPALLAAMERACEQRERMKGEQGRSATAA